MRADPEPWTDPRRPVAGSADPGTIHGARDRAGRGGGPPDRPRPRERAALFGDPTTARRPEDGGGPARRAREALHGGQARGGPRPRASKSLDGHAGPGRAGAADVGRPGQEPGTRPHDRQGDGARDSDAAEPSAVLAAPRDGAHAVSP